jgi:serine/threonine protein kinase, bacterial
MLLNQRYKIIKDLGEGGFGKTHLAEDTQMPSGRYCVIKQLKPIANDPQIYQLIQERFQREAVILEDLGTGHPQIPTLYAYFREADLFYLVQEWIEGETLTQKLLRSGVMSESTVKSLLVELLPVFEYVHDRRIVHRDVKPDNIILRASDHRPILIDFGAVREAMGTVVNSQGNPTSSIVIGTPGFMPSEQAAGRPVFASDLYALGLTAIYLLTGKNPQQLSTDPQTGEILWRQSAPNVSPTFASVLDRAVMSHPRDRFSNAGEMLAAVRGQSVPSTVVPVAPAVASTVVSPVANVPPTIAVSHPSDASQTPTAQPTSSMKPMLLAGAIAGGLIGVSTIAGLLLTRSQEAAIVRSSSDTTTQAPAASNPTPNPTTSNPAPQTPASQLTAIPPSAPTAPTAPTPTASAASVTPPTPKPSAPPVQEPPPKKEVQSSLPTFNNGMLVAASPDDRVNVYSEPTQQASSPHYGVSGDRVTLLSQATGEDNYLWYSVQFESGATGWVRSDGVRDASTVSQGSEENVPKNNPVEAQPEPAVSGLPAPGTLSGADPGSQVNVRSAPSMQADSPHYGLVGDRVIVVDSARDATGALWYSVQFESGSTGWVREDFVQF